MRCYGAISLTATSPDAQEFEEPLDLGMVRKFLELPDEDQPGEVDLLDAFISAAREIAETYQNRDLVVKQYDLALDCFPPCEIELRQPLVSVDLIRYRDSDGDYTTLTAGTDYIVDTARGLVMPPYNDSWPSFAEWPSSAVLVRFRSGMPVTDGFWNDAGKRVRVGMMELISSWFHGRLPFEPSSIAIQEYPFTVTALLSVGAVPRIR